MDLHRRIDLLRPAQPSVADHLEAVKWIGNEGTHSRGLTTKDLLDGAEILEQAIALLYDRSAEEVAKRAKAIVRKKGLGRQTKS